MTWVNGYFYVTDNQGRKVYVYGANGNYQSDLDFNLIRSNNTPYGPTWNGTYFYVVDYTDLKVYVYDRDGNHVD